MIGVFNNIDTAWIWSVSHLMDEGNDLRSRDGGCVEELGCQINILDIEGNFLFAPGRDLSPIYAAGEMLWYLSGSNDGQQICHYAPAYKRFLDPDGTAWGAYGERWKREAQLHLILPMLKEQPETRQAVVTMWRPSDLFEATLKRKKDIPCTLSLQFFRRAGRLHLITTMRSNDAWFGFPYDVFCFTTLQALIAEELDVEFGSYCHQVGSMHLYDRHHEKADEAVTIGSPDPVPELEFARSLMPLIPGIEHATFWESELRLKRSRFDIGIVNDLVEEFGSNTRWTMLLGLAWMQSLPPLTSDAEYDAFSRLMPCFMWKQANDIRRRQKR